MTGINSFNSTVDFTNIRSCKPLNFTYKYSGKLQTVYSQKYTPNKVLNNTCSGFFGKDFYPLEKQNQILVAYLKNINYFDFNTEFFLIQMNAYNLNKKLFITIKLIFEQTSNGLTHTHYNLCSLNFLDEIAYFMEFRFELNYILNNVITLVIVVYTILIGFDTIQQLIYNSKKFFEDFWNTFILIKIIFYIISIVLRFYIYSATFSIIGKEHSNEFIDTDNLCNLNQFMTLLESLIPCLTLIYFLRFLDKNIIDPIVKTFQASTKNILVFMVSFFCSIIGFSFFCYFIYGPRSFSIN